jgi:hypothetical protein
MSKQITIKTDWIKHLIDDEHQRKILSLTLIGLGVLLLGMGVLML